MPGTVLHRGNVGGLIVAWGCAVAGGMLLMAAYANAPGDPGAAPDRWPAGTGLRLDARRPTLLIFLHPRCPCSRASVDELEELLVSCGGRVASRAVLVQPRRDREGWYPPDLRAALAEMPGLEVCPDVGGEEARRFGAATSGHVLLYGPGGDLRFSGGITPGRGQRGDNPGRAALLGRIMGTGGEGLKCPVFGCPLAIP